MLLSQSPLQRICLKSVCTSSPPSFRLQFCEWFPSIAHQGIVFMCILKLGRPHIRIPFTGRGDDQRRVGNRQFSFKQINYILHIYLYYLGKSFVDGHTTVGELGNTVCTLVFLCPITVLICTTGRTHFRREQLQSVIVCCTGLSESVTSFIPTQTLPPVEAFQDSIQFSYFKVVEFGNNGMG